MDRLSCPSEDADPLNVRGRLPPLAAVGNAIGVPVTPVDNIGMIETAEVPDVVPFTDTTSITSGVAAEAKTVGPTPLNSVPAS
ncbi:hypothetical protein, partial [Frankia sp. Cr2]|uniref:hypothetical protein n=1 Tax=Frankia sp. Cr2 TaxID=3073932 RepID=UPI002AD51770